MAEKKSSPKIVTAAAKAVKDVKDATVRQVKTVTAQILDELHEAGPQPHKLPSKSPAGKTSAKKTAKKTSDATAKKSAKKTAKKTSKKK